MKTLIRILQLFLLLAFGATASFAQLLIVAVGLLNDYSSGANALPTGVKAPWADNVISISGSPTALGSIPLSTFFCKCNDSKRKLK